MTDNESCQYSQELQEYENMYEAREKLTAEDALGRYISVSKWATDTIPSETIEETLKAMEAPMSRGNLHEDTYIVKIVKVIKRKVDFEIIGEEV